MPSTFASAAAGNATDSSSRRTSGLTDSGAFGDWGRRPNGATQTFRRPSVATNVSTQATNNSRDLSNHISSPSTNSGAYVPPHISASRNATMAMDMRYSKEQLLDVFRKQSGNEGLDDGLSDVFVGDWDRHTSRDEANEAFIGPEVCLEHSTLIEPLGLVDMSVEEQELFNTTVNSPLKAPNQGGQRDGQHRDIAGARKMSFNQSHSGGGLTSPISTRPFGRRRDTSDSFPFPKDAVSSPSATKFSREDPMASQPNPLVRRRTDVKDAPAERGSEEGGRDEEDANNGPFGLSRRITSGPLSAGVGAPPSPWSTNTGLGAFGASNTPSSHKRPGGLSRSESRFKNLMGRDNAENAGLGTLDEDDSKKNPGLVDSDDERPESGIPLSFGRNQAPVGSAALGGAHDELMEQRVSEQSRFPRGVDQPAQDLKPRPQPHGQSMGDEPSSPTFTNPYQSPERDLSKLTDYDPDDPDMNNLHLPGLGGMRNDLGAAGLSSTGGIRGSSAFESQPFERMQGFPPSTQRGFAGLGGLGSLPPLSQSGPWPTTLGSGTPSRERAFPGFGDMSGQHDDLRTQPFPGLGGLGTSGLEMGSSDNIRGFGGSRLGSLFPSAMQDQMRGSESTPLRDRASDGYDSFGPRTSGPSNLSISGLSRNVDSPFGYGHGRFNELPTREEGYADPSIDTQAPFHRRQSPSILDQQAPQYSSSLDQAQHQSLNEQDPIHSQSAQPPAPQQKTMVMPDRIRWIYRDPQGNTQGPWSGLEMHDWYRAGFFSPELLVKKVEDPDYEPLAQLIRRIGNSREPFLVPQIGIPGPPSTSGTWPTQPSAATAPPPQNNAPSAQPPFASSFPSFGTTLTAEQQNALERRKQEEQYLMARQKEHLAQQQILAKQRHVQGNQSVPGLQHHQQLQHQASAHSLQSQPSYGSMNNNGYQGMPPPGGNRQSQGAFESGLRAVPSQGAIGTPLEDSASGRADESSRLMNRLSLGHPGPVTFDGARQMHDPVSLNDLDMDEARITQMLEDRARLQMEQEQAQEEAGGEQHDIMDSQRLQQFRELQQQELEREEARFEAQQRVSEDAMINEQAQRSYAPREAIQTPSEPREHKLTLTEQVQKAASAKQSPAGSAVQSPWTSKMDRPIAESHPSSQTSSPLPAPAARRSGRQSVADALAAESSKPTTPAVETPNTSLAPWAREQTETTSKQPSLKEIQEAEAQRAAKREEEQAALRRAAMERELANQPAAPAPGLPSSSTWASAESGPSPSATTPSAWAKSTAKAVTTPGGTKKTLQQIQKEEEALAKKQKAAAAAAAAIHGNTASAVSNTTQAVSAGKRYADLASKGAPPSNANAASAWTTVGAGGKPKTPAGAAGVTPPAAVQRAPSGTVTNSTATTTATKRPVAGSIRTNSSAAVPGAQDDFKKWVAAELRPQLSKETALDDLYTLLNEMEDRGIMIELVHSNTTTLDSRHFVDEFLRRRALAQKGKAQPPAEIQSTIQTSKESKSGGGWSEVARKGPAPAPKEDTAFKIVAAKKKGIKR